jgi:hypothetical protein
MDLGAEDYERDQQQGPQRYAGAAMDADEDAVRDGAKGAKGATGAMWGGTMQWQRRQAVPQPWQQSPDPLPPQRGRPKSPL